MQFNKYFKYLMNWPILSLCTNASYCQRLFSHEGFFSSLRIFNILQIFLGWHLSVMSFPFNLCFPTDKFMLSTSLVLFNLNQLWSLNDNLKPLPITMISFLWFILIVFILLVWLFFLPLLLPSLCSKLAENIFYFNVFHLITWKLSY